jgi:hypothetical protein
MDFQDPGQAFKLGRHIRGQSEMMAVSTSMLVFMTVGEALFAIPAGIVLKRTGHSPWWALLCFIPIAALLGLWVLAFTSWTAQRSVTE